jgi:hypothetical protein
MGPILRACWISADAGSSPDARLPLDYLAAAKNAGVAGSGAAYALVGGGEAMDALGARLARIEIGGVDRKWIPNWLVLTEFDALGEAHAAESSFTAAAADVIDGRASVFAAALYRECNDVAGPEPAPADGFPPALQFGTLTTRTVEDEWDLLAWYETYRLPEMARTPGCTGTRRYLSVCGPGKFAILYGFTSLTARLEGFEKPIEARGLDDSHPWRLADYTVHTPMSPSIGERIG